MEVFEALNKKSKSARYTAWLCVTFIVITVFSMLYLFYFESYSSSVSREMRTLNELIGDVDTNTVNGKRKIDRFMTDLETTKELSERRGKEESASFIELSKLRLEVELKRAEIDIKVAEQQLAFEDRRRIVSMIVEYITKIGAVIIAIYMVQILLSLSRYHLRLSDHLSIVALAVKHSGKDIGELERFVGLVNSNHIDFGKSPVTPVDKLVEVAKVASDKSSTNK